MESSTERALRRLPVWRADGLATGRWAGRADSQPAAALPALRAEGRLAIWIYQHKPGWIICKAIASKSLGTRWLPVYTQAAHFLMSEVLCWRPPSIARPSPHAAARELLRLSSCWW